MLETKKDPEVIISEMGLVLPESPKPLASYIPTVQVGNLMFTSGTLPMKDGKVIYTGKMGEGNNTIEIGQEACKLAVLNSFSVVKSTLGSLSKVKKIVKITVFINSANGFTDQSKVANGASDLIVKVFGEEKGKHARSAVGMAELPLNALVEVEFIYEIGQ